MVDLQLLHAVNEIAIAAGAEILDVYNSDSAIVVNTKSDSSPITDADRRAHRLIARRLRILTPDIPLLSEESDAIDFSVRRAWQRYWLIDPLDGTKEFVERNGEFTVNIALVEEGLAVAGIVYVPVSGVSYFGGRELGAWKQERDDTNGPQAIQCRAVQPDNELGIVASRRHRGERLDSLIKRIEEQFAETALLSMGSSLKICLLAEGRADIYPRLAPTSEWDTAAAHGVLSAAGGEIVDLQFERLRYNGKSSLLNPHFVALGDPHYPWQGLLDKQ